LGGAETPQLEHKTELHKGITDLDQDPEDLLDTEKSGMFWENIMREVNDHGSGLSSATRIAKSPEENMPETSHPHVVECQDRTKPLIQNDVPKQLPKPDLANSIDVPNAHYLIDLTNQTPKPDQEAMLPIAGGRLSPNLLLAAATLGRHQMLRAGDVLAEPAKAAPYPEPAEGKGVSKSNSNDVVAEEIFIVIAGCIGTYAVSDDPGKNEALLLKTSAGSLAGTEDVWAKLPRSRLLRCLSAEAQVIAINRAVVRKVIACDSPFVSPESSEEFFNYLTCEVALNGLAMQQRA